MSRSPKIEARRPGRLPWQVARKMAAPFGELCCALFLERSLVDRVPAASERSGVTLRLAGADDVDMICKLYSDDPWLWLGSGPDSWSSARALYADRLSRGERCYLAFVDGELGHINWTCYRWGDSLPGQPIWLRSGEVYTTDALTPARFRGQGLHAFVLGTMLNDARDLGARHAYTLGQLDRPDALKGLYSLGWREIGRVTYFQPRGRDSAVYLSRRGVTAPLFRQPAAG